MEDPFAIADEYVDRLARLRPILATSLGIPGADDRWGDLGLAGHEAVVDLQRSTGARLRAAADHPDPDRRLAATVLAQSIAEQLEADAAGDHLTDLGHMASTFQRLIRTLDLMDVESDAGQAALRGRLHALDEALAGYADRLHEGRRQGLVVAKRQVRSVIAQARRLAAPGSSLDRHAREDASAAAVAAARAALGSFAEDLERRYLPEARVADGVGEENYRRRASRLVGDDVDPHADYAWGWAELRRVLDEMARVAEEIEPGTGIQGARARLETDPAGQLDRAGFLSFIAGLQTEALERLSGDHFTVDPRLATVTVDFAPPDAPLGAFYLRPSEDFSRPGGIRYAVGDATAFPVYHHVSTAYHEGFPGHHLQIGTQMTNTDRLSRAQRTVVWYPGYSEGWALYAERLMDELGFLDRPEYRFGMLAKHAYRAARVVVDIGLHLDLGIPADAPHLPGQRWSFSAAVEYMQRFGFRTPDQAEAEVMRYLGWPGQAISYKLGERAFLSLRADVEERLGSGFDLRAFHAAVLAAGPMRFPLLRQVVAERLGATT